MVSNNANIISRVLLVFLLVQLDTIVKSFSSISFKTTKTDCKVALFLQSSARRQSFGTIAAAGAMTVLLNPFAAVANDEPPLVSISEDLTMPAVESAATSDAEMQARIQRKLELQKKNAKPISFTESLANEQEKQKSLKKSKEERRQAMCEELGRGC